MRAMRPDQETSDETLAVRAARGDSQAMSILVRRYSRPLYSFIRRYHPDRDDCDDLFQETWFGVLSGIKGFDPERRFSTWLFQVALNRCRDLARRSRTRSRFRATERDAPRERDEDSMDEKLEASMVIQAIEEMPARQKEVLLLRYYNGLSEAEVSEIVGCPRGTVKSRLHQAIKDIRLMLRTEEAGP